MASIMYLIIKVNSLSLENISIEAHFHSATYQTIENDSIYELIQHKIHLCHQINTSKDVDMFHCHSHIHIGAALNSFT